MTRSSIAGGHRSDVCKQCRSMIELFGGTIEPLDKPHWVPWKGR
jgi:hypothetical protein